MKTVGGLIVNEREDGDIEIMNEDTEAKLFLSKPELKEIAEEMVNK